MFGGIMPVCLIFVLHFVLSLKPLTAFEAFGTEILRNVKNCNICTELISLQINLYLLKDQLGYIESSEYKRPRVDKKIEMRVPCPAQTGLASFALFYGTPNCIMCYCVSYPVLNVSITKTMSSTFKGMTFSIP